LYNKSIYLFGSKTNFIKFTLAFYFIGNNADNRFGACPSQNVCHFQFEILSKSRHVGGAKWALGGESGGLPLGSTRVPGENSLSQPLQ